MSDSLKKFRQKKSKILFLVCFIYLKNEQCERIAQVARQKWAAMSELLTLLTKNERMSELLVLLSKSLIHSFFCKKKVIRSEKLRKPMSKFPALPLYVPFNSREIKFALQTLEPDGLVII